jgi:hypothetical protein
MTFGVWLAGPEFVNDPVIVDQDELFEIPTLALNFA